MLIILFFLSQIDLQLSSFVRFRFPCLPFRASNDLHTGLLLKSRRIERQRFGISPNRNANERLSNLTIPGIRYLQRSLSSYGARLMPRACKVSCKDSNLRIPVAELGRAEVQQLPMCHNPIE